jgi:drug/metabolite transporter (DMT)-like permease
MAATASAPTGPVPLRYWALIVLLGAVWGCSFLFNAILVRELGPIWISGLRTLIGGLGCWAFFFAARRTALPTDPKLYAQLLVLGILNYAIPFTLYPIAAPHVASGIIGVINGMTPMTTVIVSQLWVGGEKANRTKIMGVLIGFAGAIILASPSFTEGGSTQLWAIGACLLATLCYAITLNYARRFKSVDSTTVAASSLTSAAIVTIPVAFLAEGVPVITLPETWAALFAIGLLSSTFAFLLLYWLLPRVGATNMSLNTYITPISAILLGVLVLHERFELVHVLGIVVIFIGLVVMDGRLLKRLTGATA